MNIYFHPKEIVERFPNETFAFTIGNFDGVHLGHQTILKKMIADSKKSNQIFFVISFWPHPKKILGPKLTCELLTTNSSKKELLQEIGLEHFVEINFDRDFSSLGAREFLEQYILVSHNIKRFYLGHDFCFGKNKEGNFEYVKNFSKEENLEMEVLELEKYQFEGQLVSSSFIRELLKDGNVTKAKKFLLRPYRLIGIVKKGDGRGKKIGIPTANINQADDLIIPLKGVYSTKSIVDGRVYQSVTNIGPRPTFGGCSFEIETHFIGFDEDIYGKTIQIDFYHRLRDEIKFDSVNSLVAQIKKDIEESKKLLKDV